MWEPSNVTEKKFQAETQRLIGESKLHEFGEFLKTFTLSTSKNRQRFCNALNVIEKPILLEEENFESISVLHLTHSDNKTLSRILSTLGGICREIELLKNESVQIYSNFLYYEENIGSTVENLESLSQLVESFLKVHSYIERSNTIINLTLKELSAILNNSFYVSGAVSSFLEVLKAFADLLICLLKIDTILDQQVLKDHWQLYRRSVKNLVHDNKINLDKEDLRLLDKTLGVWEHDLLSGRILKQTVESLEHELIVEMKRSTLNMEFQTFLNTQISELEKNEENIFHNEICLQINVLFALYCNIFGIPSSSLTKKILELNKKSLTFTIVGNILWYPEQFLLKHVPSLAKFLDEKSIETHRLFQIKIRNQNLKQDCMILCVQACHLIIETEKHAKTDPTTLRTKQLQAINTLFVNCLNLVHKISTTVKYLLNIHLDKNVPVTKTTLLSISKLIEVSKSLFLILSQNVEIVVYFILLISQHLQHKALSILTFMKKNLKQDKSYKDQQLDILSAYNVCENALKGPNTRQRILVANLAISASGVSGQEVSDLRQTLSNLDLVSNFLYYLGNACDSSFLYWHHDSVLPVYFSKIIATKSDISRYYLMLNALSDCCNTEKRETLTIFDRILAEKYFGPINQIIEVNLRLQTHFHLSLPASDPTQNYFLLRFNKCLPVPLVFNKINKIYLTVASPALDWLTQDSKLKLVLLTKDGTTYKSVKNSTEHYLSTMFYNLTTVVLHDWKSYGEMRKLAHFQYSLETVDDNLPMQTLDQGLDVLEIMRNIGLFTQKYLYNLNTQVFIEKSSNNKHLNSIGISHVANSIRTHGIGIMNTTVNFIYQFLRDKFYVFSQFMFDEHIKSRLLKDIRFFNEHKNDLNRMYPYEKAEKFNVGIRKLGLSKEGETYLDLFRKLISHIGNAMGYIRLVRSGGKRCLAEETCFLPYFTGIVDLREILHEENLTDMSKKAVTGLLDDLQNFLDNIDEATEYFRLLLNVFLPVFRSSNNIHLSNFYVIVPPLTINFVEHSLTAKEKLFRKNKLESAFTDDGFSLGLAYIIELLDQEKQFNSLHWFESVKEKFKQDRAEIKKQTATSNVEDTKLTQTLNLTERKISAFEKEFQLLYYSYTSARRFFHS